MSLDPYSRQAAIQEFERARFQAALRHILARLTRTSDELLSYEQVASQLHLSARTERGIQSIPVAAIVGSVGRAADFDRSFLPRRKDDLERWTRVRNAFIDPKVGDLPPIEVYQVGEAFFVLDGNHRVSVARHVGATYIDAYVIEIHTPVHLTPDTTPDDLICQAEYAQFLEETGIDPGLGFDLNVSLCGQYPKLREQIAAHQFILGREQGRELPYAEAAADWLAKFYAPIVLAIRERGLQQWFPERTETDLYLWVTDRERTLEAELGWDIRPEAAVTDLVVHASPGAKKSETAPGSWRALRLADRYIGRLFKDVLMPLHETPACWCALDQAIVLAQKEGATIHGLHIVRGSAKKSSPAIQDLRARFLERCAAANVTADFAVETGSIPEKICERGLLTDLIALNVSHPPAGGLSALTSGWRAILKNAARPVLAVPDTSEPLARALVLFDGTPNSQEALFVAAYMAEGWNTALTVLVVSDDAESTERAPSPSASIASEYVRRYLDLHELNADLVIADTSSQIVLDTLQERNLDIVLIGSATSSRWQEMRGGNLVNALLRQSPRPLLICQ